MNVNDVSFWWEVRKKFFYNPQYVVQHLRWILFFSIYIILSIILSTSWLICKYIWETGFPFDSTLLCWELTELRHSRESFIKSSLWEIQRKLIFLENEKSDSSYIHMKSVMNWKWNEQERCVKDDITCLVWVTDKIKLPFI